MLYTKIFPAKFGAADVLPAYDWAIANRSNGVLRTDAHSMLNLDMLHFWLKIGTGILILDKSKPLAGSCLVPFPHAKIKYWVKSGKLKIERV